jgi:hypothetical protein
MVCQVNDKMRQFEDEEQHGTMIVGMVYRDPRGLPLADPYMGVKIDNSHWFPVMRVNDLATELCERALSEEPLDE